ncbi:hypothetical protein GOP47_0020547 [Adiantum capillus-veneris]|uniref:Uncharacterized protein n=1 Tax=Adiantum capillus-veneris TaxID=13818 RepID=A0A9D4Z7U5_ADICA|nr:hypothetical protein GOP47_0020547 [Adiantum capillus-veneris]
MLQGVLSFLRTDKPSLHLIKDPTPRSLPRPSCVETPMFSVVAPLLSPRQRAFPRASPAPSVPLPSMPPRVPTRSPSPTAAPSERHACVEAVLALFFFPEMST